MNACDMRGDFRKYSSRAEKVPNKGKVAVFRSTEGVASVGGLDFE